MRATAAAAVAAALAACSVLPKSPDKESFDLRYRTEPVACRESFSSPLELPDFVAEAPFDRTEMVVTQGREVRPSRGHLWVDRPGAMVAATLRRDLDATNLFPSVLSPRDAQVSSLELSGHVYRFAWDRNGQSAHAVFEADVEFQRNDRLLLHKRYDLSSDPVAATDDAAAFARAMSSVVGRFSVALRQDLCAARQGAH
jgi:ABC-type uncharacterized transport system auxiliary subunit